MRCLCRPGWACSFLFLLFLAFPANLSPSGDETCFLSPGVGCCPWIRPQPGHTGPTELIQGFGGVVPLPRPRTGQKSPHRGEFWFSLQNELTPPPKGGGAGFCSTLGCSSLLDSSTTASHGSNGAGLGSCWCPRTPARPVVMTEPDSIAVTRVSGRKTRLRGPTSTTKPMTLASDFSRKMTTTSWILPTWSPKGSKTLVPASFPM